MKKRPKIGTTTTKTVQVRICKECGCEIGTGQLCDYQCKYDGFDNSRPYIIATYERTDTLIEEKEGGGEVYDRG